MPQVTFYISEQQERGVMAEARRIAAARGEDLSPYIVEAVTQRNRRNRSEDS